MSERCRGQRRSEGLCGQAQRGRGWLELVLWLLIPHAQLFVFRHEISARCLETTALPPLLHGYQQEPSLTLAALPNRPCHCRLRSHALLLSQPYLCSLPLQATAASSLLQCRRGRCAPRSSTPRRAGRWGWTSSTRSCGRRRWRRCHTSSLAATVGTGGCGWMDGGGARHGWEGQAGERLFWNLCPERAAEQYCPAPAAALQQEQQRVCSACACVGRELRGHGCVEREGLGIFMCSSIWQL